MQNLNSPRIIALETHVVDQIAAGEVLERPAHMVKELLENSLDAGATEVELHLGEGGRALTLTDNGRGFHPDDLRLALKRHTTSKLKSAEDLWALSTYGFRGEALASISAVSKMNIRTHRKGEKCVELQSEFGVVTSVVESNQDFGTKIQISELYQNTPARLKFLKTDAFEVMEIKKVLYAFGLCQPKVSFKLFYRDRLEFYWPGLDDKTHDPQDQALLERNKNILNSEELYGWMRVFDDIEIRLQFSPPHETAKSNRKLWTFVQSRWVQEPMILAAIKDGFQNTLLPGEYPIGAIFVQVPKDSVDVNVHPTKSKVKFKDQSRIYRAVRNTLLEFVEQSPWRKEFLQSSTMADGYSDFIRNFFDAKQVQSSNTNYYNTRARNSDDITRPLSSESSAQSHFELKAFRSDHNNFEPSQNFSNFQQKQKQNQNQLQNQEQEQYQYQDQEQHLSSYTDNTTEDPKHHHPRDQNQSMMAAENSFWSNLMVIGQVGKTYLVTQNQNEIVYIDQHAAHERCLFEKLWQGFKLGRPLETQRHLLPLTFKVEDEALLDVLIKHQEGLKKIGIHFEQSGPQYIEITETPALIKDSAVLKSLEKMLEQILKNSESFIFEDVISDVFATQACHSAIRAGQLLTKPEMDELLNLMDEYPTTSYCPHGRPVFVRYSFHELEKDFCRKL